MFTDELAASAETMKDLPGLFNPCLLSKVSYHLVPFTFFFYVCDFSLKIFIKKERILPPITALIIMVAHLILCSVENYVLRTMQLTSVLHYASIQRCLSLSLRQKQHENKYTKLTNNMFSHKEQNQGVNQLKIIT